MEGGCLFEEGYEVKPFSQDDAHAIFIQVWIYGLDNVAFLRVSRKNRDLRYHCIRDTTVS